MSGYPETGNVLVKILTHAQVSYRLVRSEELVADLDDSGITDLAMFIKQLDTWDRYDYQYSAIRDGPLRVVPCLEAEVTLQVPSPSDKLEESELIKALKKHLGQSIAQLPPWQFMPCKELEFFGVEERACRVVKQIKLSNETEVAILDTPDGTFEVIEQPGYIRAVRV